MPPSVVCIVTTSRAEYGVLRWTMEAVRRHSRLRLQVLATGAHLSSTHGSTYRMIESDGFRIDAKVPMKLSGGTAESLCLAMGECLTGTARALSRLRPDIVFVAGDRYELLPICSTALVLGIPIGHMSGGDVTEGAIDNQIRHAVTKMANLHFPGTPASARRIALMGESPRSIFMVGEPGTENFRRTPKIPRKELAHKLGLEPSADWALFTYHPETLLSTRDNISRTRHCLRLLENIPNLQAVLLDPNADFANRHIAAELRSAARRDPNRFRLLGNLGPADYTNFMRHARLMIGNSSAGLLEAPSARLAVIDVGDRQKGRLLTGNVVHASGNLSSLQAAWTQLQSSAFRKSLARLVNPFGDGRTGERIARILARTDLRRLPRKGFVERPPA